MELFTTVYNITITFYCDYYPVCLFRIYTMRIICIYRTLKMTRCQLNQFSLQNTGMSLFEISSGIGLVVVVVIGT